MVKAKSGLGKGLGALIPADIVEEAVSDEGKILNLEIKKIKGNKEQPRKVFDDEAISELAQSIKEHGLLQPILVREKGKNKYEIIAGERRFRACKSLGMTEIPAIVKEMDDEKTISAALIENIQRKDLSPIEEGETYKKIMAEYNYTQAELADKIGKSRVYIANTVRLLSLPEEILLHLSQGRLSAGHCRPLLSLENSSDQILLAEKIIKNNLTVRGAEALVKAFLEKDKEEKPVKTKEENINKLAYRAFEDRLRERLGAKVSVSEKRITIDYSSDEELENILAKVGVDTQL